MSAVAQIGQPHIREEDVEKGVNKRTKRLKNSELCTLTALL